MTHKQFYFVVGEMPNYSDVDAFASDLALSSTFADDTHLESLFDELKSIWNALHMTIAQIRKSQNLTQAQMAEMFCIPKRTIENWEGGKSSPAIYETILILDRLEMLPKRTK